MHTLRRPLAVLAALSVAAVAAGAEQKADPLAEWQRLQPASRSARLEIHSRLALHRPLRLVALDLGGPLLDDGVHVFRVGEKLSELARATGAVAPVTYWWRGGTLMGVDASDRVSAVATPLQRPSGRAVYLGGAFYYATETEPTSVQDKRDRMRLVRYDLATRQASVLVGTGRGYDGAIATDGKDIFVADRQSLWKYEVSSGRKQTLPGRFYWPGALALEDNRFLIDIHGKGAAVFSAHESDGISLGTSLADPSSVIGWSGETALITQTQFPLKRDTSGSLVVGDYARAAEAITCWRVERASSAPTHGVLHTLYRTAPGVRLCDIRIDGRSIAWLEYRDSDHSDYCEKPDALVSARLVGACE